MDRQIQPVITDNMNLALAQYDLLDHDFRELQDCAKKSVLLSSRLLNVSWIDTK